MSSNQKWNSVVFCFFLTCLVHCKDDDRQIDTPIVARRLFLQSVRNRLNDLKIVQAKLKQHQKRLLLKSIFEANNNYTRDAKLVEMIRKTDENHVENGIEGAEVINRPVADLMFQSDMILNTKQVDEVIPETKNLMSENGRSKRQAQTGSSFPRNQWSINRPISFFFDESIDPNTRQLIRKAVAFWQEHTCLSFQENGNYLPRIRFFRGGGCYSQVGKDYLASIQDISIGRGCEQFGIITHEIAHTLGFFHSQSRHDRDTFIEVVHSNLTPQLASQFVRQPSLNNNNFGVAYDYGSVMHYADTDTARGVVTILAKDRIYQHTMGNNVAPSFLDILEMNIYYNCVHQQSSRQLRCNNGGFQKPTDPNRCVCPTGFGGSDCSQLQKGEFGADAECGQVIMATNVYQTLSNRVSAQSNKLADRHAACFWHIKAPKGQRVQMKILKIYGACSAGCFYAGLEIKFRNFVRTGARICCQFDLANMGYLESEGNLAIVLAYSSFRSFGFKLKFRAVGNPSEKCVDEQSNCNSLVNLCSHPRYYKLMTTQCAKTCMRCVSTSETPVTPIRNLEPDPEIASPDLPECGERDECSSWSNNGFCDSNFFTVHMKKQYCGQTCRLCKP